MIQPSFGKGRETHRHSGQLGIFVSKPCLAVFHHHRHHHHRCHQPAATINSKGGWNAETPFFVILLDNLSPTLISQLSETSSPVQTVSSNPKHNPLYPLSIAFLLVRQAPPDSELLPLWLLTDCERPLAFPLWDLAYLPILLCFQLIDVYPSSTQPPLNFLTPKSAFLLRHLLLRFFVPFLSNTLAKLSSIQLFTPAFPSSGTIFLFPPLSHLAAWLIHLELVAHC